MEAMAMTGGLFWVALQSSLVLGLVHGVNPCGHSWVLLAPFVVGRVTNRRAAVLTASFIAGTALACLAIGLTLGAVSMSLPDSVRVWTELLTSGLIVFLGLVLALRPHLLHSHDHCHVPDDHDHDHDQDHDHDHDHEHSHGHSLAAPSDRFSLLARYGAPGLFVIGFVNMIVPCPTAAMMYSYALQSGAPLPATLVFGAYALGTGVALAVVIAGLRGASHLLARLESEWVEPLIMRGIGLLTIAFGLYSLFGAH